MAIQIIAPDRNTDQLRAYLQALLPGTLIFNPGHPGDPNLVEMAILWKQPAQAVTPFINLKAIHSLGAGVDHLIEDQSIPRDIPIARIVDEQLTEGMRRYVLMAVLNFHKNLYGHLKSQQTGQWTGLNAAETTLRVGILGFGQLGRAIALDLKHMGFEVAAYSRSDKKLEGIRCFSAAKKELTAFLASINTVVCLLPLTPETEDFMDWDFFQKLPDQSFLINVGRGKHLVEADLLRAIKSGKIRGACLDVLREEPLPKGHPFWEDSAVILTPHIASVTNQEAAAQQIAQNYKRIQRGEAMIHQINRSLGY
ncbi:MAG: glyoxylate/hydroxypyruvate reductase A [Saprospiraceae bacterium]